MDPALHYALDERTRRVRLLPAAFDWLDEVLADELTLQVKRGMTAARPSYLPQGG